jgi:RND superfamily putative drug exporter
VTGLTAGSKDFNDAMNARLPYVFAFVLGLAFCCCSSRSARSSSR